MTSGVKRWRMEEQTNGVSAGDSDTQATEGDRPGVKEGSDNVGDGGDQQ